MDFFSYPAVAFLNIGELPIEVEFVDGLDENLLSKLELLGINLY